MNPCVTDLLNQGQKNISFFQKFLFGEILYYFIKVYLVFKAYVNTEENLESTKLEIIFGNISSRIQIITRNF